MFVSFDNSFKEQERQNRIPDVILDYLNSQLESPDLRYVADEDGNCTITSINGKYEVSGISIELTKEMRDILGDYPKSTDILEYSYNSQRPIPVKLLEEGYIFLNGEKIGIEKLKYNPLMEIYYDKGSFQIIPMPMKEEIELKISGFEEEILLGFKRIPDNSLNWIVFVSANDKPIRFLIKFNREEHKMVYSISYDLKKASNIQEAIKVADIYDAFAVGKGKINDTEILIDKNQKRQRTFTDGQILFWKKMFALEDRLGVKFNLFLNDITNEDIYVGEILYRTLVCKTPVRVRNNIISVKGIGDAEKFDTNKPMAFYFQDYSKAELFGAEIELRGIKTLYNCIITDFYEEDGKFNLTLEDESDKKIKYTVAMYFLTEEELEEFKDVHNIIEEFVDAKKVNEYYNVN